MGPVNMQINVTPPSQVTLNPELTQKKMLLLGDTGIGKKRFIERVRTNKDVDKVEEDMVQNVYEDIWLTFHQFNFKVDKQKVPKVLLTSQSTLKMLSISHYKKRKIYKDIDGVIFMYDSGKQNSFDNIKQCIKDLQLFSDLHIVKFLVGMDNSPSFAEKMEVSRSQHKSLAAFWGLHDYGEVSMADADFFETWVEMVRKVQRKEQKKKVSDAKFKLLMIGSPAPGKTTYASSLLYKPLQSFQATTRVNCTVVRRQINGFLIKATIFDSPSSQYYWSFIHKTYMSSADGIILFYDKTTIQDQTNQLCLQMLAQQIEKHTTDVPVVLVGNKTDLIEGQQQVNPTIRVLAQKYKHFDCSAKSRQNVDEALNALLEQLIERNKEKIQANRKRREQQMEHSPVLP